jgi:hypothetical protein
MNKDNKVVDSKEVGTKVLEPETKNPIILAVKNMSDVEKNILRELLGIRVHMSNGTRVTGKVKSTGKKIEVKVCKQMEVLINSLPKDKAVDINEWAELAVKAGLQTQQPPARIVAYYKRNIMELGFAVTA